MRLAAQQKGGYYAAAPEAVRHLAQYVRPPTDGPLVMLDPCAGRGEAIQTWATVLGVPPEHLHAIELEDTRAAECHSRLAGSRVLGPCSMFGCHITGGVFSFIWLNPPFDDAIAGGARVEAQFLDHATRWLRPGGVMALACPASQVKDAMIQRVFRSRYDLVSVVPFPPEHRPFDEVCIFARKRARYTDPDEVTWQDIRSLTPVTFDLPAGTVPPSFVKTSFTPDELLSAIRNSPLRRFLQHLPEVQMPRPPLELGVGHLALLLSSGHLDGLVEPPDEPPHVVRGVCRKVEFLKDVEATEDSTKLIYSERIEMLVRTVDVTGRISTLGGEKKEITDGA